METINQKQKGDLGRIFQRYSQNNDIESLIRHPEQRKAFDAIAHCRTKALGGHIKACTNCGKTQQAYNSCRNRHCPKCQFIKQAKWVDRLACNLPPVKMFHIVFTIPPCLHKLFYINQRTCYDLLLKAAGQTLCSTAANPKHFGVQAGALAVLHTWGQTLSYHPHVHMIVPAGGFSEDKMEWHHAPKKFFVSVKVLSKKFRYKLCMMIKQALKDKVIRLPNDLQDYEQLHQLTHQKDWVVYCEKPFSTSNSLIAYLGNYTQRVAISNHRILSSQNGKVCFSYKDYRCKGVQKEMHLPTKEFIRRFLQHILPRGFCKIRYIGFLSTRKIREYTNEAISLLNRSVYIPQFEGLSGMEILYHLTGIDVCICSACKRGHLVQKPPNE